MPDDASASWSDEVFGLFTGGLRTALDLEAEKQRAEISNRQLTDQQHLFVRGDSSTVPRGQMGGVFGATPATLMLVALGVGVLAVVLLVRR